LIGLLLLCRDFSASVNEAEDDRLVDFLCAVPCKDLILLRSIFSSSFADEGFALATDPVDEAADRLGFMPGDAKFLDDILGDTEPLRSAGSCIFWANNNPLEAEIMKAMRKNLISMHSHHLKPKSSLQVAFRKKN
jgi:hypothetical protein